MWIEVYNEEHYKIEKRIETFEEQENGIGENKHCAKYSTPREYIVDKMLGRYRLLCKKTLNVLCGCWSFNKLVEWAEKGLPELFESVSFRLKIGGYIKTYEGVHSVVILGNKGIGLFSKESHKIIQYANIRKIEVKKEITICAVPYTDETDAACSLDALHNTNAACEYERETCEAFQDLDKEILSLSLNSIEGGDFARNLLLQRISERVCATIPLYNQKIKHIVQHSAGSISLTNDFMVVKENLRYLIMPLCMIRKVEIIRKWKPQMIVKDANGRVFDFVLEDDDPHINSILAEISKEVPEFKNTYFSIFFDIVSNAQTHSLKHSTTNWSMGNTSEYRMYLCIKLKDNLALNILKEDRPYIWMGCFCLCGMASQPDLYTVSIEKSTKTFYQSYLQIDMDIERSMYEDVSAETLASLKRIMYAFATAINDEYLQSHTMVAAVLYKVLGESGCFYGLVHIFSRILPDYTGADIYGMRRDVCVLIELAQEKYPGLYENLHEKSIEIEILITPWILGLFTTLFMQPQIEYIFDHIAYHGASFIFKLSLALLERMYQGLSKSQETVSILKISKNYFFKNTNIPSISSMEFSALLALVRSDTFVTSEIILYKRQRYELLHRKNKNI